jgi:hypothetical protein
MSTMAEGFPVDLSYAGTVDRALIHRRHASEAFLTDVVRTGPATFIAGALLPAGHPHYGAHTGPSRDRDPMLLLECVRQAETFAAHTMFGVELDSRFLLRGWHAEFGAFPPVTGAAELFMTAVASNQRTVRDRVRGLDLDFELWCGSVWVGRVGMSVGYLSAAAFQVVRARKHGGPPPSTDDLGPTPGTPVSPAEVGRLRATDTLLLDVGIGDRTGTARLRVAAENRSLFDHPQDHVPAMVLVEAARQLTALCTAAWDRHAPDRTEMVAMDSSFDAYAELTDPVELVAVPTGPVSAGRRPVEVTFRQAGQDIARARVVVGVRGSRR